MKKLVITFLFIHIAIHLIGQTENHQIRKALNGYIYGTSYNDADSILSSFIPGALMYLDNKNRPIHERSVEQYANGVRGKSKGKHNGRFTNIISIETYQGIAVAKLEVLIPAMNRRFMDFMLLKKVDDGWKIISKTAASEKSNRKDEKALIVLSSETKQGSSDIPCGNSFSEVVVAYDVYKKAGIHVDFVSPKGGAVGLAYVDAYDSLQLEYLYDAEFMHALEHTLKPTDVNPNEYGIVQFTGGSAPIYDIPQNKEIQKIAMHIYEQNKGIVAAVCHGTAAIVDFKTSDGRYLVDGKAVNAYPDAHERKDLPFYQYVPFSIEERLKQRGGKFEYEKKRGVEYMVVDGRLVTGQNYQSSKIVSETTVKMSRKKCK